MSYRFWFSFACVCLTLAVAEGVGIALGTEGFIPGCSLQLMVASLATYKAVRLRITKEAPVCEPPDSSEVALPFSVFEPTPGTVTDWRLVEESGRLSEPGVIFAPGWLAFDGLEPGTYIGCCDPYGVYIPLGTHSERLRSGDTFRLHLPTK